MAFGIYFGRGTLTGLSGLCMCACLLGQLDYVSPRGSASLLATFWCPDTSLKVYPCCCCSFIPSGSAAGRARPRTYSIICRRCNSRRKVDTCLGARIVSPIPGMTLTHNLWTRIVGYGNGGQFLSARQAMQQAKREFLQDTVRVPTAASLKCLGPWHCMQCGAMIASRPTTGQEQNRLQNAVDPDRREFLTQQRKLALAMTSGSHLSLSAPTLRHQPPRSLRCTPCGPS